MLRTTAIGLVVASMLALAGTTWAARVNAQTKASMNRTVPAINFANVTFRDAVDYLRDVSNANVHVNWRVLETAGVTPDTTVNLKLRQVSLRKVLNMLLTEAGGGVALAWYVDEGVVEITTREMADAKLITKVYDVQDLLIEPPDPDNIMGGMGMMGMGMMGMGMMGGYSGGMMGGGGFGRGGGGGTFGGGGGGFYGGGMMGGYNGGGMMGGWGGGYNNNNNNGEKKDQNAKGEELVDLIIDVVEPDTWSDNGGPSSIRFFQGNLIVTAPRSVHEQIGGPID